MPPGPAKYKALGYDFATVVQRMRLLGFNAVHIPMRFSNLLGANPGDTGPVGTTINRSCEGFTVEELYQSVSVGNYFPGRATSLFLPTPGRFAGDLCNTDVPNATRPNLERFAYVVDFIARRGMYVYVELHPKQDTSGVLQDPAAWAQQWQRLVRYLIYYSATNGLSTDSGVDTATCASLNGQPVAPVCTKLIISFANDVSGVNALWNAPNGNVASVTSLYKAGLNALAPLLPNSLFLLMGAKQTGFPTVANAGFSTSEPNNSAMPFLDWLTGTSYKTQVVMGFDFFDIFAGTNPGTTEAEVEADIELSTSWLSQEGYRGQKYPVVINSFGGSNFADAGPMGYLSNVAAEQNIVDWFYWCWNGESTPPGVANAADHKSLNSNIIGYLQNMGLRPVP